MGQNLSAPWPDTSKDVLAPFDQRGDLILLAFWGGAIYLIAMIFTTARLIDRWRGPRDERHTGFCSLVGALILSIAWPAVLVVLALSSF